MGGDAGPNRTTLLRRARAASGVPQECEPVGLMGQGHFLIPLPTS